MNKPETITPEDCAIRDIGLEAYGRKELDIAETRCRG